ncbi:hypothetical protein MIND_01214000 [Mycena indigotica]|uniref:NAD(P)-binding domain-containing protein n=1 Tax=Mycena indigotica TaxID=2126181 RepID=A0A8H6VS20_9AGAR|nr:uncharacterized protein MIND_01214000 [Mycena indigotica]KAF7291887.1 hypothetical protein MIND_01214000 [Mycena indigotica]
MHVVIFGASGAMGQAIARRFLAVYPSSTLVLYVRDASKLPLDITQDRSVIVIEGQLDEMDNISKALEGCVDAVISALGPTGRKGPLYPSNKPIATAYTRIISVMKHRGIKRLIALTTPSVRDPSDQFHLPLVFLRAAFATLARNVVKDIIAVGEAVKNDGAELDWTLIRLALQTKSHPTQETVTSLPVHTAPQAVLMHDSFGSWKGSISMKSLTPSEPKEEVIAGYMGDGRTRACSSRGGAAAFIIDELERREWVKKAPILS